MGGGLINIVSYVSNDLYLTGAPQITFYKMVYRRYTNFAMESMYLDFNDNINFNHESELIPPRTGDLLHKGYLHINIPTMDITKQDVGIDVTDICFDYADKSAIINYEKINTIYMNIMTDIYRIVFNAVNAANVTYATLMLDVQEYMTDEIFILLDEYDTLLTTLRHKLIIQKDSREIILDCQRSNLWYILTHININKLFENTTKLFNTQISNENNNCNIYDNNDYHDNNKDEEYTKDLQCLMKNATLNELQKGLDFCKNVQQYFFDEYNAFMKQISIDKNKNIKCAWVKNLGHSIIEYIDIFIGGKRIDRHYGIWINIWYQLTYKEEQIQIYNNLIGNVASLTNFDNEEKPSYDIYVPLSFWFCKFNGLSFPLIAMQYNDIRFNVKLRKFEEVFFIERIYKAELNGSDIVLTANLIDFIQNRCANKMAYELSNIEQINDISLEDIWENKGKFIHGHILMDYIYLESAERKRFAQSGHEYLIEKIQTDFFTQIQQTKLDVQLNFINPSKEIIWAFLKDVYTKNEYGTNGCRWYDHGLMNTINTNKNPIIDAKLTFNTIVRIQKMAGRYFDTYQPFMYHKVSPSSGINMYSFCLDPLQHQPTGSCNFTRLKDIKFFLTIDDQLYRYTDFDIYPYDLHCDFKMIIPDSFSLMNLIDIEYARKIKNIFSNSGSVDNVLGIQIESLMEKINTTIYIYDLLSRGKTNEIWLHDFRKIFFLTTATFYVFDVGMNILRLIGGYGDLAYGNC